MFGDEIARLRKLGVQGLLFQLLNFLNVVASGLMMWKALCLVTNSESPIVVVLSGSMQPAFYRGDILFLTNPANTPYEVGDITVYKVAGQGIPIVHRVHATHETNGSQLLLTKGDANPDNDIVLYEGPQWLESKQVVGKVRGFLPYVGYVTIAMLAILFFSTSPSSPFIAALAPDTPTPEPTPDASVPPPAYDEHIADRGAFYLNGGRIFDPVLVGYREMQRAWSDSAVTNSTAPASVDAEPDHGQGAAGSPPTDLPKSGPAAWPGKWKLGLSSLRATPKDASKSQSRSGAETIAKPPVPPSEAAISDSVSASAASLSQQHALASPPSPPSPSLPPGYVDLRIGGIGFVVDLGWRRTDQGLHWEVDDIRHARATRDARRRGSSGTVPGASSKNAGSVLGAAAAAGVDESSSGKAKGSRRNSWLGASFVGSW
ncbi:Signal peptidase complex catalytic subunit SEC11 [Vanrija pseudolonga]|uniref:Signal peptidase complex catalytic subunit SEC11 n=1 Tax=Vanrija pseudolonga TaxID=143232 RepID=A0AAF0YF70_9TREE|nr:Signal peptidase complex catalytic subunit SEC11 [Vanrija pseudolonga]